MIKYKLKNSETWVTLGSKPFASGGEGNLYAITAPHELRYYVAKIYHPHKLSAAREQKIAYLAQFPPVEFDENEDEHSSVIWVKDALYAGDKFVGFIMPYTHGEKLEILCTPKIPNKLKSTWRRFDFKQSTDAADLRLKLCFNICAAIHQVHSTERYVLVDMKPDNIVIQPNGLVSIVDTDSVEVIENGKSIFDAPVATPEYTPPEHYQKLNYDATGTEEWDRFGLGVILYKLLFGIHPFAASSGFPQEHLVSLSDKIEHGLFVHHPAKSESFTTIPPPHKAFYTLDENLQALFMRCFIDGHHDPTLRPSAEEWCATLLLALNDEGFYKRYGHMVGGITKSTLPRFALPSNKILLPNFSDEAYKLVALNKENNYEKPQLISPSPKELKTFQVKKLSKAELIIFIVAMAIASTIGTPIVGGILLAYLLRKNYRKYKKEPNYKHGKIAEANVENARQKYQHKSKKIVGAQRRFQLSVWWILPKIEKIGGKIQKELDGLKNYLKTQDERVRELERAALAQYRDLNKRYAEFAQSNRLVARMQEGKYDSLSKMKIAINTSQKKAVDLLTKQHPISNENPMLIEGKIAIDLLIKDKRLEIKDLIESKISIIEKEETEALQKLFEPIKEETDLIANIDRLWKGRRQPSPMVKHKLVIALQEIGCLSIFDIDAVNNPTGWITLKNGQKIAVKEFYDSKYSIKNLLHWLDENKHQMTAYNKEKGQILKTFQQKKQALADEKRMELKGLENLQKKELEKVKIGIQKEVLGAPFSNLQEQYETVTQYVEELEVDCAKEEEVLLEDYNELYQDILRDCQLKVQETEQKMASLKKDMDYYNNKAKHPKVQTRYNELKKELEEIKQLIPDLEQKELEYQKYKDITFVDYLKELTGRFQF